MKLSIYLVGALLMSYYASALRDPFRCAPGKHRYALAGVGILHNTRERFAMVLIDGDWYTVCQQDVVAGHTIMFIFDRAVILKDDRGCDLAVHLK